MPHTERKKVLEICCYSPESAIDAEKYGANRIELCDNYSEGGTTPSFAAIKLLVERLSIPINVMIRPRGGDFLYSELEYEIMKEEVQSIRSLGANGIVAGFLEQDGGIDLKRTREIVDLAGPMEVTFHRAFDMCEDPEWALEQLIDAGVKRILTSGTRANVDQGKEILADLVSRAGDRITIMPGSGVGPHNMEELIASTHAQEYHSSAKCFEPSQMSYFNPHVSMGGVANVDEYQTISVDEAKIKSMLAILKPHS